MATSYRYRSPPPTKVFDLELTIVSAKHLKNVNWKTGDLKPYAIFWVDPHRKLATKSDDSGSTRPVWNERFTLSLSLPPHESYLTLEVFHSKPSEAPKPLVGTLRVALKDLSDPDNATRIRTFDLLRPSGRPQGKMRLKLGLRERPLPQQPAADYRPAPPPQSYYYSTCSIPPPPEFSPSDLYRMVPPPPSIPPPPSPPPLPSPPYGYHDSYSPSPYYSGYYSSAPLLPRPFLEGNSGNYGGPSAPVDYSPYNQRQRGGRMGFGTGLAVGAVAGALGGLALEEELKYGEERIAERVESELGPNEYTRGREYF